MKKTLFLLSFLLVSNFAFAGCYEDMVNDFNGATSNYRDALADQIIGAGLECMAGIEAASTGIGAALAVGILINCANESEHDVANLSNNYGARCEQIHDDFCACLGSPPGC